MWGVVNKSTRNRSTRIKMTNALPYINIKLDVFRGKMYAKCKIIIC